MYKLLLLDSNVCKQLVTITTTIIICSVHKTSNGYLIVTVIDL